jgi:hypothetical protein
MATYRDIREDIKKHHGRAVKTRWIAHVKELNGLDPRPPPNRHSSERMYPCPDAMRPAIEASMRRFGIL